MTTRFRTQRPTWVVDVDGYAMAALLGSLVVMGVLMSMLLPVWSQAAQREREAELAFRGEQYARAIELYQRRFAGAFPPDVDSLVEQRFLRRLYKDPMMEDGEFQILYQAQGADVVSVPATAPRPGQVIGQPTRVGRPPNGQSTTSGPRGGVIGVVSKSTERSLRIYNGGSTYSEWLFVHLPSTTQLGGPVGRAGVAREAQRLEGGTAAGNRGGAVWRGDISTPGIGAGRPIPTPGGPSGR